MLATTRSYLMVLKTTYKDPKTGKELCGFTSKMGASAPAPRLLRLKTGAHAATAPRRLGGAAQAAIGGLRMRGGPVQVALAPAPLIAAVQAWQGGCWPPWAPTAGDKT